MEYRSQKYLFFGLFLVCMACADQELSAPPPVPQQAQKCTGGHTPVTDKNFQPLGCNKANHNVVKPGEGCTAFGKGAITIDRTGAMYVCQ